MKILLVGEYSNLHCSLKEGLDKLGHDTTVIGLQDGFKKIDVSIIIKNYFTNWLLIKIKNGSQKLFNVDLQSIAVKYQLKKNITKISGYDVVQFINESSFNCNPKTEIEIFNLLKQRNKKMFLLSCGDDYISNTYNLNTKRYSILTPELNGKIKTQKVSYSLKYLTTEYQKLHQYIFDNIRGVIASDIDYHLPLLNHPKYLGMIANPINCNKIKFHPLQIDDKIIIFHGINTQNYYKKGNDLFEEALALIEKKYAHKITIITTRDLPYKKYIEVYNTCHILLDQVYAFDQGFNALEAMAKGKVVFTGAEQEWLAHYNLKEDTIAINALPDAQKIAQKLSWLIDNPSQIHQISLNARSFIEEHHNYVDIAKKYLSVWS